MILILVNIFEMNKKELYEKDVNNNHLQLHKKIKFGQYLKILKVPDQTYMTISVIVIFKFV